MHGTEAPARRASVTRKRSANCYSPALQQARRPPTLRCDGRPRSTPGNGFVDGEVSHIDPATIEGTVPVAIKLLGETLRGALHSLNADGTIKLQQPENALHLGRPICAHEESFMRPFRLVEDGRHVFPIQVWAGKDSVSPIEIHSGLSGGRSGPLRHGHVGRLRQDSA